MPDTYEAAKNLIQRCNPKIEQYDRATVINNIEFN